MIRFIVRNSIEEQMISLQEKKRKVVQHAFFVANDNDDPNEYKSNRLDDFRLLFQLQ